MPQFEQIKHLENNICNCVQDSFNSLHAYYTWF